VLGYETCTRIAKRALEENKSIVDLVREERLLSEAQIAELLSPESMTQPYRAVVR
jgi:aspartate ammonia-lyase